MPRFNQCVPTSIGSFEYRDSLFVTLHPDRDSMYELRESFALKPISSHTLKLPAPVEKLIQCIGGNFLVSNATYGILDFFSYSHKYRLLEHDKTVSIEIPNDSVFFVFENKFCVFADDNQLFSLNVDTGFIQPLNCKVFSTHVPIVERDNELQAMYLNDEQIAFTPLGFKKSKIRLQHVLGTGIPTIVVNSVDDISDRLLIKIKNGVHIEELSQSFDIKKKNNSVVSVDNELYFLEYYSKRKAALLKNANIRNTCCLAFSNILSFGAHVYAAYGTRAIPVMICQSRAGSISLAANSVLAWNEFYPSIVALHNPNYLIFFDLMSEKAILFAVHDGCENLLVDFDPELNGENIFFRYVLNHPDETHSYHENNEQLFHILPKHNNYGFFDRKFHVSIHEEVLIINNTEYFFEPGMNFSDIEWEGNVVWIAGEGVVVCVLDERKLCVDYILTAPLLDNCFCYVTVNKYNPLQAIISFDLANPELWVIDSVSQSISKYQVPFPVGLPFCFVDDNIFVCADQLCKFNGASINIVDTQIPFNTTHLNQFFSPRAGVFSTADLELNGFNVCVQEAFFSTNNSECIVNERQINLIAILKEYSIYIPVSSVIDVLKRW
ncbi:hypothetical protein PCE1_004548 [Barthelona sp. PCE]